MFVRQSSRAALVAAVTSVVLASAALAQPGSTASGGSQSGSGISGTTKPANSPLVVPLPMAAYAGLTTLAGVIGLSVIRRRRHTQG